MEKLKTLLKFVKTENIPAFLKGTGQASGVAAIAYAIANLASVVDVSDPLGASVAAGLAFLLGKASVAIKPVK